MRVVSRSKGLILFLLPKRERGKRKKKEKNKRNLLFPLSPFLPPVAFNYDPQFPLFPRLIKFDQEEFREIVRPRDEKKSHDRTNSRESEASIAGSRGRSAEVVSMPCFIGRRSNYTRDNVFNARLPTTRGEKDRWRRWNTYRGGDAHEAPPGPVK